MVERAKPRVSREARKRRRVRWASADGPPGQPPRSAHATNSATSRSYAARVCELRPTSDSAKASNRHAVSSDVVADMLRCPFAFGPPPIAPRYPGAGAPQTTSVGCAAMGESRADGWYDELDGT